MPSSCPICEQPIASTAAHCAVCGFPTGLAIEGLRSIDLSGGEGLEDVEPPPPASPPPKPTATPPSPEEEIAATISRDLRARMEIVRELGRGPDITSDLCQAALSEAEGRVAEALEILRSTQSRLDSETGHLLRQRFALLGQRRETLQRTGVRFALDDGFERLGEAIRDGRREEATTLLVASERRLAQFESDWKGLQGLLAQAEGLRSEATELGIPLGEISTELEGLRDRLRATAITQEAVDTFAQEAAQMLMLLHDAIPNSLEAELARHGKKLEEFPDDHAPSAAARRLHLEASRHLTKGRIPEAVQSVRELRRLLVELEHEKARTVAVPAPSPTASAETTDEMLDRLLKKARSLAARVRTLPAESEAARDAAVQIREATDLLRARQLTEADLALSRLMRMLASEPARS